MTKGLFLKSFYQLIFNDIVGAFDIIDSFHRRKPFLSDDEFRVLLILRLHRYRFDIFRNFLLCADFVCDVVEKYPRFLVLFDFDARLSKGFLSSLLTYKNLKNYVFEKKS